MRWSIFAILLSALSPAVFAGVEPQKEAAQGSGRVNIENFGQVNEHIYRGGQPEGEIYRQLTAIGIKTILDLRGDSEPGAKSSAEAAGFRYINLPLAPKQYPQPDAAKRFLDIVNDQANWPVYVHCAGGRHRTGAMIAVYRISMDGWDLDRTYNEMKDFDFYTRFGHGCYKEYVNDYYRTWQASHNAGKATNASNFRDGGMISRFSKMSGMNKVAGFVERPLKRAYRARPLFKNK